MHDPGSPGIGFIPSQADRSAPVSGAGQLPRYLRGGYRDATPLLKGIPRPSSGPRHSTEPAPQRRTLAARYRSADPIDLDGATVYPMYSEQLPTPASALTMTLLSATPPTGLAAVGIGLSVIDGYIDLDDRHLAGVDIWRDALERGITFDLAADSPEALFALTPVWSNAEGEPQSWSGNYGIVVERTETGRTVLWCSMGEGPPHFADLVVEVLRTPLDPHPRLVMPGAVPLVSTVTPSEPRPNRHHWVEAADPTSNDLEHDPWTAHYEPATEESPPTPPADEPPAEPIAVESRPIPATDDSAAVSSTYEPAPTPLDREPTAPGSPSTPTVSALTTAGPLTVPTVSTSTTTNPPSAHATRHPTVDRPTAPSEPALGTAESRAAPHAPALTSTEPPVESSVPEHTTISRSTLPVVSTPTDTTPAHTPSRPAHTTADGLRASTGSTHSTAGAAAAPAVSESTTADPPYAAPNTSAPTTAGLPAAPAVSTSAAADPLSASARSTPTASDCTTAPMARDTLTAPSAIDIPAAPATGRYPTGPTAHNALTAPLDLDNSVVSPGNSRPEARDSPGAHSIANWATTVAALDSLMESPVATTTTTAAALDFSTGSPAAETVTAAAALDSRTQSPVDDTAPAGAVSDPVTELADDPVEIQGYPCSFADIRLSTPAHEYEPDCAESPEATVPQRVLVDDFAGYDDPLTGTDTGRRYAGEADSYPGTGRHGWAENPELTGLVPIIHDAGGTDYGPEPARQAATDSTATISLYGTPLLAGDRTVTEFAVHDDCSLVNTRTDDSLAPVPPADRPPMDDGSDLARLHSLGAVAHAQGDDDRAHLLWTRAARAGHLGAIYDLGALSLRRDDPLAAERWWRAAAARRMIPAMAELAALLEQRGAVAEARMWRTQAVAEEVIATASHRAAGGEARSGMH